MKKADIISIIVNSSVIILSGILLYKMFMFDIPLNITIYYPFVFVGFICIVIFVHFCKMSRLFMIMLEQKVKPLLFLEIYSKTAFANLMIPYKLGEIYRIYCLTTISKNVKIGLLSVIIDRFFDTFALILFLVPMEIIYLHSFTFTTILLIVFLLLCVIVYTAFPSIYTYLNKFLIMNTRTKKSVKALGMLEEFRGWYEYSQGLLKGRIVIIFVLSIVAWGFEYFAMFLLYKSMQMQFVGENFVAYINSIFFVGTQPMTFVYFAFTGAILAIAALVFYIIRKAKKQYLRGKNYE